MQSSCVVEQHRQAYNHVHHPIRPCQGLCGLQLPVYQGGGHLAALAELATPTCIFECAPQEGWSMWMHPDDELRLIANRTSDSSDSTIFSPDLRQDSIQHLHTMHVSSFVSMTTSSTYAWHISCSRVLCCINADSWYFEDCIGQDGVWHISKCTDQYILVSASFCLMQICCSAISAKNCAMCTLAAQQVVLPFLLACCISACGMYTHAV